MGEQERTTNGQDNADERLERTATEIIVGLGGPAIISAGVIGAKLIERLPKKEASQDTNANGGE